MSVFQAFHGFAWLFRRYSATGHEIALRVGPLEGKGAINLSIGISRPISSARLASRMRLRSREAFGFVFLIPTAAFAIS